jgi:hypothetical protein
MKLRPDGTVKRVLSIAFLAALVMLGARTCSTEAAECTLSFSVEPERAGELQDVEVRLLEPEGHEVLGQFRAVQDAHPRSDLGRWQLTVPAGEYRLEIEITTARGRREFERTIELQDRAEIVLHLDPYLGESTSAP